MKKINFTRKPKGQGMVEFALTIPIFLMVVFGLVELSRFFLVYSSVYTASREATRYASSVDEVNGIPHYSNCVGIRDVVMDTGFFSGIDDVDIQIDIEDVPGSVIASCLTGDTEPTATDGSAYRFEFANRVRVEVTAEYQPIFGQFFPPLPVTATNARTILKDIRVREVPQVFPTPTPLGWLGCDAFEFFETYSGIDGNTYVVSIYNRADDIDFRMTELTNLDWSKTNQDLISVDWELLDVDGNSLDTMDVWDGTMVHGTTTLSDTDFLEVPTLPLNTNGELRFTTSGSLNANDWVDVTLVFTDDDSGIICENDWVHP